MADSHNRAGVNRPFALEHRLLDPVWIIRVRGEVDMTSAPELTDALWAASHDGTGTVVVDLCETTLHHVSGLHLLLSAHRRLSKAGRRLVIACPEDHTLHTSPDRPAAAQFASPPGDRVAGRPAFGGGI
jgi:anti-anti-sigma factor